MYIRRTIYLLPSDNNYFPKNTYQRYNCDVQLEIRKLLLVKYGLLSAELVSFVQVMCIADIMFVISNVDCFDVSLAYRYRINYIYL